MKKVIIVSLLLTIFFSNIITPKADSELLKNAKSGLLMEASTGQIIYDKNGWYDFNHGSFRKW